jgi:Arc/MetJ-type ribon-helix-helix transcriptional regulator
MRLDFRNIGKGLEAVAGAKKAQDLAQASARYDVTEGAYGPGLQENITQLEGLKAQDPAQAAAYDKAIGELTRRQGLTAPDYSVASGVQNYDTRQEARQVAAPLRAEGLAGVYRRYGDVAQADALEARAYEQQRALAQEERAKAAEGRAVSAEGRAAQEFGTRQTETGLRINAATLEAAKAQRMNDFNTWRSQNPQADFASMNAEAQRLGMGVDEQFKVASNLTGIGEQEFKASQQRIQKLVKNQGLDGLLKAHKESNDIDPGSHFEVSRGKNGVTLNRVDTATGKIIQANVFSGNEAEATAYLNKAAMDPATIIDYTMNLEKSRAAIDASKASAGKDKALAGLYAQGGKGAGAGAGKPSPTESLVSEAEKLVTKGAYKDLPTAIEALKKGSARDADKEAWLKAEQKLIENDATPEAINAQRTAFFVRRGYAPAAARQVLESGVNPSTGKPLTKADVDTYNATYPQTPVDLGSLPWLQSPEREARRQGLISQIPR